MKKRLETPLVLTIILVLLTLGGIGANFILPSISASSKSPANLANDLLSGSPPTLGSSNATVSIVDFGDFQCPTCGEWFKTQETLLIQNLINTGRAKLIWRDFDYYGPDSVSASEAAYAAGNQGKFWQFHNILFQNQQTPNNGWASRQNLERFAQQLTLNMNQFDQDFNSGTYDTLINSNHNLGVEGGVTETPTFFVIGQNGQIITIAGGQPESVFEQAVGSMISTSSSTSSAITSAIATTALPTTNTANGGTPSKCFIATATFGSELSPEVQLLRGFRDNSIMKTAAGSNFMVAFNAWYYSFSPYVANYLRTNYVARTIMKGVLYPLIGILWISSGTFSALRAYPEVAALLSGLVASALIGAFYIGLPLGILRWKTKRFGYAVEIGFLKITFIFLLLALGGLAIGELLLLDPVMILSTSAIIVSTVSLVGAFTSLQIANLSTQIRVRD